MKTQLIALGIAAATATPVLSETLTVPESQWELAAPIISNYDANVKKVRNYYRVSSSSSLANILQQQGIDAKVDPVLFRPGNIKDVSYVTATQATNSFNDPLLKNQSAYNNVIGGYSKANDKWEKDAIRKPNIVIMDSGSLPSDDIVFSGGYSYTTVANLEEREDYTDVTPVNFRDEDSEPNYEGDTCYSGHGLAMAGIMGAKRNNNAGIAGVADANLYMARVVAQDCATNSDVGLLSDLIVALESLRTSNSPVGISGNEVDVVNISLASETPCTTELQGAINDLVELGVTIVASSGNQGEYSTKYAPANCNNVISVAAHQPNGALATFSNTGPSVDVMSNGYWYTETDSGVYGVSIGTSGAAAAVSGSAAFLRSLYGKEVSPSEIEILFKEASRPHLSPSVCDGACGEGIHDLYNATLLAESVIEPVLSYNTEPNDDEALVDSMLTHTLSHEDDCLVESRIEAFGEDRELCNAFRINTFGPNVENDQYYHVRIERKPAYISSWSDNMVETVRSTVMEYEVDKEMFEYNRDYDYRTMYCAELTEDKDGDGRMDVICPFPVEFSDADFEEKKPANCR